MTMDELRTCGKGLAQRSTLPARLSALTAAMAEVLETHQQTLDLTDDNAWAEHVAYQQLAEDYHRLTSQLRATADRMFEYRDLPMARHHAEAMLAPQIREALANLVNRERELAALLKAWVEEDQAMLVVFEGVKMSSAQTESLHLTRAPITETGMLIRKPVAEVFEAIVNPEITTKFWFTRSSGRLAVGRPIRWEWQMYDVSIEVTAKAIDHNRRIVVEWPGYSGSTTVEWTFAPVNDGNTFVRVTESGFTGTGDQLVKYVADSTQGFTLMLAGLKAFLEHGVKLNLVGDRYPKGVDEHELTKG